VIAQLNGRCPLDEASGEPSTFPTMFEITARNLPEHATNAIHTDAGAQAAGFPRALVAGVTTYAYAVHPIVDHFGMLWAEQGTSSVEFRSPVFDGERLAFVGSQQDATLSLTAQARGQELARVSATASAAPPFSLDDVVGHPHDLAERPSLQPLNVVLEGEFDARYALRAGDDLTLFTEHSVVHPAVWPALANRVFHEQLVRGAWVHTGSRIRHHRLAPVGRSATVVATVARQWMRGANRWATALVAISVDDVVVASLLHTAIVEFDAVTDGER
jgi:acyl dehydratase